MKTFEKTILFMMLLFSSIMLISCDTGNIINNTRYTYSDSEKYSVGDAYFPTILVENIDINWYSGNVYIEQSEDENISFYEIIDSELSDDLKVHYLLDDGTLYIKYVKSQEILSYSFKSKELHVKVPQEFKFNTFKCALISASISLSSLNSDICNIETLSGNINAGKVNTNVMKIEAISGNINISSNTIDRLRIDNTSGIISITKSKINKLDIESISGKTNVSNSDIIDYVNFESISSSCELSFNTIPRNISFESTSGNITLLFPLDTDFIIELDSTSGTVDFDEEFKLHKNGKKYYTKKPESKININVDTISGSVHIKNK